jgi:hypothetical protein
MNYQDIESVVQSGSTSSGWSFSQVQLFALGNLGFYVGFDRRSCFTAKRGLGSVEITTGRNFKLDAWEYQRGLGLEYKVRYFKTFQSLLNYLKKVS